MAYSISSIIVEDFITRRWLIKMSRANLQALGRRLMDMVRILYMNPAKCFSRKNNKNYTTAEAAKMLDGRLETLGVMFDRQYNLVKGVLESDKKKYDKIKKIDINDREIIEMLISKSIQIVFE